MSAVHTEKAFEDTIEAQLVQYGGWTKGDPTGFDRVRGLDPTHLIAFIQVNQSKLWAELKAQHKDGLEAALLDTLTRSLDSMGSLEVIRRGFKFFGKTIDLAAFQPANSLNPDTITAYNRNILTVTRQVKFIPNGDESLDMVLALNGLPIATVELKSHLTGQNVWHAVSQYKSRDPKQTILKFKRGALVHFAVDPDRVRMTTHVRGKSTYFLPFDKGHDGGAGNPPNPNGHRTAYLWEEVWQRDSFLDIVGRFIHLLKEERTEGNKKVTKEKMVFPRYHQLDAVRRLEAAARGDGPGKCYLIQHSAGSGKSNSIAWLAHRLQNLHGKDNRKVFDCIVVVTDRQILDRQLQDNIYQFEHKQGVVAKIEESSGQLAEALQSATPIIITTLQKFPFVTEKIGQLPGRTYAVIVDEAHSSQSGEAAHKMKEVLVASGLDEAQTEDQEPDHEDEILRVMKARGRQANLSFFAFTATPKAKTLEFFGTQGPDGKPLAFHLYSMRQAIEEGFILDVLKNYTTYKTYYKLVKATADDPKVSKKAASKSLARFMSLHPHNIAQKTEVMAEHFRQVVQHQIGGRAKAMVVTSSRLHAVRYRQAFDKYLREHNYSDIGVLVAFSGTVRDPDSGAEFTEVQMNGGKIPEKGLRDHFKTDEFKLLLVANKYQTGFDEPLLQTMYVDKRLSGIQAVQTLSRLNRMYPGKEDTFVLDFVNDTDEIQRSFQPYYEQTTVAEQADPNQLYELQHKLDGTQVYFNSEVEAFCRVFYAPRSKQAATDQGQMVKHLDPSVDRFKALDEEQQEEFRTELQAYTRLYAFLAQVMPFSDPDLEKLYTFGRFLLTKLPQSDAFKPLILDDEVALRYYRLQKLGEQDIILTVRENVGLKGPTEVGTGKAKDPEVPLSEIIEVLNERFGTDFNKADQLLFDQFLEDAKADPKVIQQATANPFDNFELAMRTKLEAMMIDRMDRNEFIVTKYLNDPSFREVLDRELSRRLYEEIRVTPRAGQ